MDSLIDEQHLAAHQLRNELRRGDSTAPVRRGPSVEIIHWAKDDGTARCGARAMAYRAMPIGRLAIPCHWCGETP